MCFTVMQGRGGAPGVSVTLLDEAVKAVITLRPGQQTSAAIIQAMLKEAKGAVSTPKPVDFIDSLPLTALDKPDKKQLREQYWSQQDRAIH